MGLLLNSSHLLDDALQLSNICIIHIFLFLYKSSLLNVYLEIPTIKYFIALECNYSNEIRFEEIHITAVCNL